MAGFGHAAGQWQGFVVQPGGDQFARQRGGDQAAGTVAAVDVQAIEPRAGGVRYLAGVFAEGRIGFGKGLTIR